MATDTLRVNIAANTKQAVSRLNNLQAAAENATKAVQEFYRVAKECEEINIGLNIEQSSVKTKWWQFWK
jgi:hypothetical protein